MTDKQKEELESIFLNFFEEIYGYGENLNPWEIARMLVNEEIPYICLKRNLFKEVYK